MSRTIEIRNVPDWLHRVLKARAAREGISLSAFVTRELERSAERPTMREWLEAGRRARPIPKSRSAAEIVRELRDAQ